METQKKSKTLLKIYFVKFGILVISGLLGYYLVKLLLTL